MIAMQFLMISLQVKLLNSISDNLDDACKDPASMNEFLTQFQAITKGVEVNMLITPMHICLTLIQIRTPSTGKRIYGSLRTSK